MVKFHHIAEATAPIKQLNRFLGSLPGGLRSVVAVNGIGIGPPVGQQWQPAVTMLIDGDLEGCRSLAAVWWTDGITGSTRLDNFAGQGIPRVLRI